MRIQPRQTKPRVQKSAALRARIAAEVDRMAVRFDCSRAFVIDTALADAFGIDTDIRAFDKEPRRGR